MNILDPNFRYTSSVATDLRKTFARVRSDIAQLERAASNAQANVARNLLHIAARRADPAHS
jgi:hypothetical protein